MLSSVFDEYKKTPKQGAYDFYRCYVCGWVFSRAHELRAFNDDGVKSICICGSAKYSPTWPHGLEWLKPGILSYTFKLFIARGVAPWCDKYCPWVLPALEPLVRIS